MGSDPLALFIQGHWIEEVVDLAFAVAERILMDSYPVQQREMEIGQRRALFVLDVPPTPHAARRATRDQNGKVLMVVQTGVAHPASVQVDRVVEQ